MTGRRGLVLLIAAHVLLGLFYAWATPVFEAPDEGYHTAVVRWIALGRGLPVQEPGVKRDYAQEGSQPPLYYLLGAGLTAWMDTSDWDQVYVKNPRSRIGIPGTTHNVNDYRQPAEPPPLAGTRRMVYALRAFSLMLNAGALALAHALARRVVPAGREPQRWLALALVAFNPMMLFIGASVNNDNLLRLVSTAALVVMVDAARAGASGRARIIGLGVLLGLAALTKISGLVLWPAAALAIVWARWTTVRHEGPGTKGVARFVLLPAALDLLATFLIAALICGWWYARNWQLYGDPLGLNAMIAVAGPRRVDLWTLVTQEWYGFYLSFWAIFGVFTILPPPAIQWFFHALTVLALAGLAAAAWRARRRLTFNHLLLAVFCLLTLAGVIRWTMQTPASQGRLLFGAIAPLGLGLAAGLLAWLPGNRARAAAWSVGAALAVVAAVIPFVSIAPKYTPPRALTDADLPPDLRPVRVMIGAGMELAGYTADDAPRRPGEAQTVTLYWRALAPMEKDYVLALVLFGRGTEVAGQIDTWPGAGLLATSDWRPGALYADTYTLPVNAALTAPTRLRLSVSAWEDAPDQTLPIRASDGRTLNEAAFPVGRVAAAAPPPAPAVTDGSTFEHGITLLGYSVRREGGALRVTFTWQTDRAIPADYTLFLHVLDAGGEQIGQADGPPLDGDWPTSAWLAGQPVADARAAALPAGLAAADCCSLRLGWYDPVSGARLAAFRPDGARWPDDAVILEDVPRP